MTASRIGGSSGIAAIAAEIPASRFSPAVWPRTNPRPVTIDDQPDGDDEQDPDEAVQLALERRAAVAARAEAAGDPADLGRLARRDDDPLAAAADDARPRVGEGVPLGERRRLAGRARPWPSSGHRLAGEDAAVDEQPIDADEAEVGRHDVAAAEQDDVARHDRRRQARPRRPPARGPARSGRSPRGAPRAPARRGTR